MAHPALASRRLFSEFKALSTDPPVGIIAGPVSEDDIFVWEALIEGPEGTPFEGGVLCAELHFPKVRRLSILRCADAWVGLLQDDSFNILVSIASAVSQVYRAIPFLPARSSFCTSLPISTTL